ncbi:MAG TPA: multicopper oxidase domain-containing protein [Microbacterium sp.]|nr:multicopper oxidase domain-containing protein [Microbacterium sp.]
MTGSSDRFPTATEGLAEARPPETVELADGERYEIRIAPVAKRLGDTTVRMLAYNGSIPGPVLRVKEGTEVVIDAVNEIDLETTVHWHGLRLDNRYDGTATVQTPMPVGGSFSYRLTFPDPGAYWYHPHVREDYEQEMGLYGTIIVEPAEPDYWPPVNRELALTLDDLLLEDGAIAPFSRSETTYVAMGRFGNVLLTNGDPDLSLTARNGEVIRFHLTNTANTRVFNVALPGARMKRVGGDSGHYEQEELVEAVLIAPSERVVVDVLFGDPGQLILEHRTPERTYPLATITISEDEAEPSLATQFAELRTNADMVAVRKRIEPYRSSDPDKTLALVAEMDMGEPELPPGAEIAYTCPMHPEIVQAEPGHCPKCGMKLLATAVAPISYACPMHPEVRSEQADRCPKCGMKLVPAQLVPEAGGASGAEDANGHQHAHGDAGHAHEAGGIEWEDDMVDVNRVTTPANTRWKLVDRATGAEGRDIDWRFRVGDLVKIRVVNEMDSDHPMHHPLHIHGAGRFLILSRDGTDDPNLVWKDTVLIPTGQVVDILLEVTNPGDWVTHCHIAEHHEGGMLFNFHVDP